MLNEHSEKVNQLIDWYEKAKEIAITAESLDSSNTGFIQPLHEQRYALDHFVRSIVYEKHSGDDSKIEKALDSAIAHLQRSYSDSVEWMLVTVKDEFVTTLKQYKNSQISDAFSAYYERIRPALEEITQIVNEYKINKSIEEASCAKDISDEEIGRMKKFAEQFIAKDVMKSLETYRQELHNHVASLIEAKKRDKREFWIEKVMLPIVTAIIGGLIVWFFTK